MSATWTNTEITLIDIKTLRLPDGGGLDLALVQCHHESSDDSIKHAIKRDMGMYFEVPFQLHDVELYDDSSKHDGWRLYRIFLI